MFEHISESEKDYIKMNLYQTIQKIDQSNYLDNYIFEIAEKKICYYRYCT